MRKLQTLFLTALLSTLLACGGTLLGSFQLALASSRPLVDSLVASGAIPQSKANDVINDFGAGVTCGQTLQSDFKAIPSSLTKDEKRGKKLEASQKALQCFRRVIARGNLTLNERLEKPVRIADGILASLVLFYGGGSSPQTMSTGSIVTAATEDELMKGLKVKMKELNEAMKP